MIDVHLSNMLYKYLLNHKSQGHVVGSHVLDGSFEISENVLKIEIIHST